MNFLTSALVLATALFAIAASASPDVEGKLRGLREVRRVASECSAKYWNNERTFPLRLYYTGDGLIVPLQS